jgi:hypothetical protein
MMNSSIFVEFVDIIHKLTIEIIESKVFSVGPQDVVVQIKALFIALEDPLDLNLCLGLISANGQHESKKICAFLMLKMRAQCVDLHDLHAQGEIRAPQFFVEFMRDGLISQVRVVNESDLSGNIMDFNFDHS